VRAIADGGVSHGITHVSWAIPVRYLADLVQSSESATALQGSSANLSAAEVTRAEVTRAQVFSADFVDPTVPTINCGSARLRKARTRTLAEAELGSDSPIGLQQLKTMGLGGVPPDLPFDVYEDAVSGATVAVPAGVPLQPQGPSCRASIFGGQVELVVSVTGIPPGSNPGVISAQFELFAATPPPMSWMPDPAWSYLMPFYRPDGFIVRRKAFKRFVPNPYNLPTDYMFETLAARNGTFLGVAAIRHSDLQLQLCQRGVYPPQQCPNFEYMRAWAHVALSVQLSTFAISALNPNSTSWQQTDRGGR
jgi:hypothetical protein